MSSCTQLVAPPSACWLRAHLSALPPCFPRPRWERAYQQLHAPLCSTQCLLGTRTPVCITGEVPHCFTHPHWGRAYQQLHTPLCSTQCLLGKSTPVCITSMLPSSALGRACQQLHAPICSTQCLLAESTTDCPAYCHPTKSQLHPQPAG
jgi:hypothetical protein